MIRLFVFGVLALVVVGGVATQEAAEAGNGMFSIFTAPFTGNDDDNPDNGSTWSDVTQVASDAGRSIFGLLDEVEGALQDATDEIREPDTAESTVGVTPDIAAAMRYAPNLRDVAGAHEGSRDGYSRDEFPHWHDVTDTGCTTRQDLLIASAVEILDQPDRCWIAQGTWHSAYDDVLFTGNSSELDADHVVSLSEAWRSGASEWTLEQRRAFANDPLNVIIVTRESNSEKSDLDFAEWQGSNPAHRCLFATTIVDVKAKWDLTADPAEMHALVAMLASCADGSSR